MEKARNPGFSTQSDSFGAFFQLNPAQMAVQKATD